MRVVADLIRGGAGSVLSPAGLACPSVPREMGVVIPVGGEAALMGEREGNRRYD